MRAPTPFEKQRGARLILEAAGRLRPRRRVVAAADGASSVAEVEAAVAAVALVVEAEEEEEADTNNEERAAWRAMLALNRRLRAPPVVAAILRLFPLLVAQARRQAPDTHRDDGVKYDMTALPDAFVLAQHPRCFLPRHGSNSGEEGEDEVEEAQHSARMMVDAAAALAVTFEVLLNEFRLRPRRRHHQHDDAPIEGRELLLQIRAYQDAFAAAVVSKRAAAPTRASSSSA